jgi:photosystem II stability/assembly factor-like uncharacterized protein
MRKPLIVGALLCCFPPIIASQNTTDAVEHGPHPAEVMPLASQSLLLAAVENPDRAVVVGERGHILLSEDRENWRQASQVPVNITLNDLDFYGRNGWAVGHDATILHTSDGGENWQIQHYEVNPEDPNPLLDVLLLDARNGIAIGAYGMAMRTSDGGANWERVELIPDLDWHLNSISRIDETTLFIAAEAGNGYISTDLGETWEELMLPYGGSMFGAVGVDNGILTFGLRGNAFFSDDAGQTWERVEIEGVDSVFAGHALNDGRVVLAGANGVVWYRDGFSRPFQRFQQGGGNDLTGIIRLRGRTLDVISEQGIERITLPRADGG